MNTDTPARMPNPTPGHRFEDRLLDELKAVAVADRAQAATPVPVRTRITSGRRRLAYGLAASAVVATSVGIAGPALLGGKNAQAAAFTVVQQPDGGIRFAIHEFRDPQGLEARLRQLGANVKVDYLPPGKNCAKGRFATEHKTSGEELTAIVHWLPGPTDRVQTDDEIAYYKKGWQEIRPELIPPGTTLVLTWTSFADADESQMGTGAGTLFLADGPVGACRLVDDPGTPRMSSDGNSITLPRPSFEPR